MCRRERRSLASRHAISPPPPRSREPGRGRARRHRRARAAAPAHATFPGRNGRWLAFPRDDAGRAALHRAPERPRPAPDHRRRRRRRPSRLVAGRAADRLRARRRGRRSVAIMTADGSGLVRVPARRRHRSRATRRSRPTADASSSPTSTARKRRIWSMQARRHASAGGSRSRATADPNVSPDGRALAFSASTAQPGRAGAVHQSLDGRRPLPAHAVQLRRRLQARLGAGRPPARVHRQRRLRRPGDVGEHRHDPPGRHRPALRDPLHAVARSTRSVGSYSPDGRRIVFRLRGPRALRPLQDAPRRHARAADPPAVVDFAPRFIDWGPASGHGR